MIARMLQVMGGSKSLNYKEIWAIFKQTLALVRSEPMLWSPIIRMMLLNLMFLGSVITSVAFLFSKYNNTFLQVLMVFGFLLLFLLLRVFYFGYLHGVLSAMVVLYGQKKTISFSAAAKMIRTKIFSLGLLNFLIQLLSGFVRSEKSNTRPGVLSIVLGFFSIETLDLLGHFLVPVIVIEDVNLARSFKYLKALRTHAVAGIAGVMGIEMAQGFLSILLYPVLIGVALLGVLIGHVGLHEFPSTSWVTFHHVTFSWIVPLVGLILLFLIWSALIKPLFEGLKLIYFSLFYLLIQDKKIINPSIQQRFKAIGPPQV